MFENLPEWFKWAFGGIGVSVVGGLVYFLQNPFNSKLGSDSKVEIQNNPQINVNVNTNASSNEVVNESAKPVKPPGKKKFSFTDQAKNEARLLFIDDDTRFKLVKILKEAGWLNVEIRKDAHVDDAQLKSADIVFVDIQGVGKKMAFQNEGLGLANAIMDKYPLKYVVIYSSERNGNRFDEIIRKADDHLYKHADVYTFEKCLENLLVERNG